MRSLPFFSIVTALFNGRSTVVDCVQCLERQEYNDYEHLILDGLSTDGGLQLVEQRAKKAASKIRITSEPDRGIYDALNKGTVSASGDYVGILHADDLFFDNATLSRVAEVIRNESPDIVFGNLVYVDLKDTNKIRRRWHAGQYSKKAFRFGWMPPHPTVFVRSEYLRSVGPYRTDLRISGDYELLIRAMYLRDPKVAYIDQDLVRMRVGGVSNASISNRLQANREDRLAWSLNGLKPPHLLRLTKPLRKIGQFLPFWA
jgi:glycosyltransferase involved in cell wall biosynthesis